MEVVRGQIVVTTTRTRTQKRITQLLGVNAVYTNYYTNYYIYNI